MTPEREEPGDARAAAEKLDAIAAEIADGLADAWWNVPSIKAREEYVAHLAMLLKPALLAYGEQVAAPLREERDRAVAQLLSSASGVPCEVHAEFAPGCQRCIYARLVKAEAERDELKRHSDSIEATWTEDIRERDTLAQENARLREALERAATVSALAARGKAQP